MDQRRLLEVHELRVHFPQVGGDPVRAVDGVSFTLGHGEALAVVGETGSGKTTLARALLGLFPREYVAGSIRLNGEDLNGQGEAVWQTVRGRRIALAVQNAGTGFDPVYRVGDQIVEPIRRHLRLSSEQAWRRARLLAEQTGLAERHLQAYPHQLSGGEKQRLMLAMALSCDPDVLILDEPTSGQDMRSRAQIVDRLRKIRQEQGIAMLLITHDLATAAALTDHTAVIYAGQFVEMGGTRDLFTVPRHPYTWGLAHAYPNMTTSRDLSSIRGQMPDPTQPPTGCRFHPRCTQAVDVCRQQEPPLEEVGARQIACHLGGLQTLLHADGLRKTFRGAGQGGDPVAAVRGVALSVLEGEVVGVIGETGSGKSTLGRLLSGLLAPDAGTITLEGERLGSEGVPQNRVQFIPQDPFESVNPRFNVLEIVREPLDIAREGRVEQRRVAVEEVLHAVGLAVTDAFLGRRPPEISGGQLQRVVIARALVVAPKLLIADEPVSMLDPSEQARLMKLLRAIQHERGMGLLLITHDLALVRKVADRLIVMRKGEIVEAGLSHAIISRPRHAYTQSLVALAPALDWYEPLEIKHTED